RELETERPEFSKLAIGCYSAQFLHAVMVMPRYQLFEARYHLLGIEFHRAERLRHSKEARLTHHDQVAKAARILIKRFDLFVDLVRRAGKAMPTRHLVREGGFPRYDRVPTLHEVHRHIRRVVAGWVRVMQGDLVRAHVPKILLSALARLGFRVGNVDERRIGESVGLASP